MVKFYGKIGYAGETVETPSGSGVWVDSIVEYLYYGDVIKTARGLQEGEHLHQDLTIGNSISILADAYANQHFFAIRYIEWAGTLWTVENVEVQRPRLLFRLGGVYNGPTADSIA